MGTTFVTISREDAPDAAGFWMRDGVLELWLRLLALHLPEPTAGSVHHPTPPVRDQWLLASRGYFTGCVPHDLGEACATEEGRAVVRAAVDSLLAALEKCETPLDPGTINLLGIESEEVVAPIERRWLQETGWAFLDLLDGKITATPRSTEIMPGSRPYQRLG